MKAENGMTATPVEAIIMPWVSYDKFDALPGDVVLRRWKSRETGEYRRSGSRVCYAAIEE